MRGRKTEEEGIGRNREGGIKEEGKEERRQKETEEDRRREGR
jgi:hypothetical protein